MKTDEGGRKSAINMCEGSSESRVKTEVSAIALKFGNTQRYQQ